MGTPERICLINIDSYRCNGCETCVSICPELFRINEANDKAEAVLNPAPCSPELDQATANCPMECIEVVPR